MRSSAPRADAQRLKASSNGHDQRKAELESALVQVCDRVTLLLRRELCICMT